MKMTPEEYDDSAKRLREILDAAVARNADQDRTQPKSLEERYRQYGFRAKDEGLRWLAHVVTPLILLLILWRVW